MPFPRSLQNFILQDVNQFKNRMGSLAYGNAMMHAAEDYKREMMKKQKEDGER